MKNIPFNLCYILSLLIYVTCAPANIYEGVSNGGENGNAGIKMRLTQKGLDYLNSVLLYQMNQIVPRLYVDDLSHNEGNGHLRITNAKVTNFKPPSSQSLRLSPPDQITFTSQGTDISINGHVQGSYGRFHDEGDANVIANNVNLVVVIEPLRQSNGQFGAKTISCDADVGGLDYNIYNSGLLGKMLQNYKGAIIKRLRPKLGDQMCRQVTKMIDEAANEQLSKMPTKVPLNKSAEILTNKNSGQNSVSTGASNSRGSSSQNTRNRANSNNKNNNKPKDNFFDLPDARGSGGKSGEARRELTNNITKHLMLDYSNIKDPSVTSRYMETYNKGEISYHGQGGTPFSPPPMHEDTVTTDRMIYGLASDYVANSMLYNAYSHDLLKTRLNGDDTPEFKSYLKTSCDDDNFDFCLGSIIPEMQDSFPDSKAEVAFEATKSPALFFRKDGSVNLLGQGLMKLFAIKNGQRKTMGVANMDIDAKAKLYVADDRIKGNCTFEKYDITIKENNLKGFGPERQKQFISSSKQMFEIVVNAYLKNGLRLPRMKQGKLKNTKLNVFDRTARIDTDVEVDNKALTDTLVKGIQKHGVRVQGY